ncbi:MAG: XkdF-like putative serine protease domain-containing protein [Bacteroidales bacterium]|jgi:hypothetical protein
MEKSIFIPIRKVDAERHEIYGWGAVEEPDAADEILDYETSKQHFQEWSGRAQKRSGGKSLGNVRSMHQPIAAGKLIEMRLDDTAKGMYVGAKIVDDEEWKKVEQGVYTGFSLGGNYAKRWADFHNPGKIRYTAIPTELSIVDAPCIPSATFEMVKAEGISKLSFNPSNGKNMIKVLGGYEDERQRLQNSLTAAFPIANQNVPFTGGRYWIDDWDDSCVYASGDGKYYKIPYTPDGDKFTFGIPIEVKRVTTYESIDNTSVGTESPDGLAKGGPGSGPQPGQGGGNSNYGHVAEPRQRGQTEENDYVVPKNSPAARKDPADTVPKLSENYGHKSETSDTYSEDKPEVSAPKGFESTGKWSYRGQNGKNTAHVHHNHFQHPDDPHVVETTTSGGKPDPSYTLKHFKTGKEAHDYAVAHLAAGSAKKMETSNTLQKQDIPGSPEPIADMPLPSAVGPSFETEQMPPPNVSMEVTPNQEPDQETLAKHTVLSEDLTKAFEAWLPKVGAIVKTEVSKALAELEVNLSKTTNKGFAPARTILVKRQPKTMISVVRKEK